MRDAITSVSKDESDNDDDDDDSDSDDGDDNDDNYKLQLLRIYHDIDGIENYSKTIINKSNKNY